MEPLQVQCVDCAHDVMQDQLSKVEELQSIQTFATRLLQISRSTPYLIAALIGHKRVCCSTDMLTLIVIVCDCLLSFILLYLYTIVISFCMMLL